MEEEGRAAAATGRGFERVGGDKVGRLILRRGEQKDPRASRPRRRKPGTRKTPPSHVDPSLLRLSSPRLFTFNPLLVRSSFDSYHHHEPT